MLKSFRSLYVCFMIVVAVMASLIAMPATQAHPKSPESHFLYSHLNSIPALTPGTAAPQTTTLLSEGFENGTKTSYTTGAVTLTSGSWTLNNALIGDTASDPKTGAKSLRICNLGKVTMNFNVAGPGTLAIKHARHGTDPQASWELWSSTNNGGTWTRVGVPMTAYQTSLGTASFPVNISSQVRFEIRKTTGNTDSSRLNFDDITFTRSTNSGSQAQPKGK